MSKKQDIERLSPEEVVKEPGEEMAKMMAESAKGHETLAESLLEALFSPMRMVALLKKLADKMRAGDVLGEKREQPSFDYDSMYKVVFTIDPRNLELESEKYDFDSFLHQILNDREKLLLLVPPNAVDSVLETTALIVGSEEYTRKMRILAVKYWSFRDEQEQRSTFYKQATICEGCLKSLARFQGKLKRSPDLLYNYQLREGVSLSEKFGPELEKIGAALEEMKNEVTQYHQMQQEGTKNKMPSSVNNAPYYYQPPHQVFELMFGIWEIIRPHECPKMHVHHIARAIERWRLCKSSAKWASSTHPNEDWEKSVYQAVMGWR